MKTSRNSKTNESCDKYLENSDKNQLHLIQNVRNLINKSNSRSKTANFINNDEMIFYDPKKNKMKNVSLVEFYLESRFFYI